MQAAAYRRIRRAVNLAVTGVLLGCRGRDAVGGDSRGVSQHRGRCGIQVSGRKRP
jgi:hypothetical protein